MAQKFKAGDIVQLKSGGPAMTVSRENSANSNRYDCVWFKGASRETATFDSETLKPYEAPKKND